MFEISKNEGERHGKMPTFGRNKQTFTQSKEEVLKEEPKVQPAKKTQQEDVVVNVVKDTPKEEPKKVEEPAKKIEEPPKKVEDPPKKEETPAEDTDETP